MPVQSAAGEGVRVYQLLERLKDQIPLKLKDGSWCNARAGVGLENLTEDR